MANNSIDISPNSGTTFYNGEVVSLNVDVTSDTPFDEDSQILFLVDKYSDAGLNDSPVQHMLPVSRNAPNPVDIVANDGDTGPYSGQAGLDVFLDGQNDATTQARGAGDLDGVMPDSSKVKYTLKQVKFPKVSRFVDALPINTGIPNPATDPHYHIAFKMREDSVAAPVVATRMYAQFHIGATSGQPAEDMLKKLHFYGPNGPIQPEYADAKGSATIYLVSADDGTFYLDIYAGSEQVVGLLWATVAGEAINFGEIIVADVEAYDANILAPDVMDAQSGVLEILEGQTSFGVKLFEPKPVNVGDTIILFVNNKVAGRLDFHSQNQINQVFNSGYGPNMSFAGNLLIQNAENRAAFIIVDPHDVVRCSSVTTFTVESYDNGTEVHPPVPGDRNFDPPAFVDLLSENVGEFNPDIIKKFDGINVKIGWANILNPLHGRIAQGDVLKLWLYINAWEPGTDTPKCKPELIEYDVRSGDINSLSCTIKVPWEKVADYGRKFSTGESGSIEAQCEWYRYNQNDATNTSLATAATGFYSRAAGSE